MRRVVLLLLSLGLLAAGCGGGGGGGTTASHDQYLRDLDQAGQALQRTLSDIQAQTGTDTSLKQTEARLARGAKALDDAARGFAKIKPPADAKSAHAKIVDGLRQLAGVFRQGAQAARKNDPAAVTKLLQGLATSDGARQIDQARKDLAAKGIAPTAKTPGGG
jgi:hypothetical protein